MKTFIYGMQSSGASLFTYFIAQGERTYAIIDNFNYVVLPPISDDGQNIVAKSTVNPDIHIDEHIQSFQPNLKVLVLRHPCQTYASLLAKPYCGDIDRKFIAMERMFVEQNRFHLVIQYEDFVLHPIKVIPQMQNIGFPAQDWFLSFPRSCEDIETFNETHPDIASHRQYGFGNIRERAVNPDLAFQSVSPDIEEKLLTLCPSLCAFYREKYDA